MNVIELFLLLGIVAFLALWRWGGALLVWLEGIDRALDEEREPVCTVEDEWFDEDDPVAHDYFDCFVPECREQHWSPNRDARSAEVIRERLDVEMRRRGHRGRR